MYIHTYVHTYLHTYTCRLNNLKRDFDKATSDYKVVVQSVQEHYQRELQKLRPVRPSKGYAYGDGMWLIRLKHDSLFSHSSYYVTLHVYMCMRVCMYVYGVR